MARLVSKTENGWTQNKKTDLSLSRKVLLGAGIGLDIWQDLFDFRDGSWFATLSGEQQKDLLLISLSIKEQSKIAREPFQSESFPLAEDLSFALFPKDREEKLIPLSVSRIEASEWIKAFVLLRDDQSFRLSDGSSGGLEAALRVVLRVHQHYLDLDFSETEEHASVSHLLSILHREGALELRSDAETKTLVASYERPLDGILERVFKRTEVVREVIFQNP